MAISRIVLSGTTAAEKIAEISEIIQEHCIPSVFDSYEDGAFYKNGNVVFRWDSSNAKFYYNGGNSNISAMLYEQEYATQYIAVYIAAHGFALELGSISDPSQNRVGAICGLDNNGNVVGCGAGNTASNPLTMTIASYDDATTMSYTYSTANGATNQTALSAIPLYNNAETHTANIYAQIFRQLTGRSVIFSMDGVEYISNGSLVLKDE